MDESEPGMGGPRRANSHHQELACNTTSHLPPLRLHLPLLRVAGADPADIEREDGPGSGQWEWVLVLHAPTYGAGQQEGEEIGGGAD